MYEGLVNNEEARRYASLVEVWVSLPDTTSRPDPTNGPHGAR